MSTKTAEKIFDLEVSILHQMNGNGMNPQDARKFYSILISYSEEFMKAECDLLKDFPDHSTGLKRESLHFWIDLGEGVQKKIIDLQNKLKRVFLTSEATASIEAEVNYQNDENDPSATTVNLNTLLRKQKFCMEMINSLAPECEYSSEKAELQHEHVSQFYQKFVSNQYEIMSLVGDDAFDDQIKISTEVQQKVLSIQGTLKEIFSPNKLTTVPESEVNEHNNPADCRNETVDVLDSLHKKQRSLIKQIDLIESKNNLGAADAETLRSHLSQIHESFIQNQAKIETYVNGPALEKELEISCEILEKVMALQTKLNKIIAPNFLPSSAQSNPFNTLIPIKSSSLQSNPGKSSSADSNLIHKSKEILKPEEVVDLNSLFKKQESLIKDIESGLQNLKPFQYFNDRMKVLTSLIDLIDFKQCFLSNQIEIIKRLGICDCPQQRNICAEVETKLKKFWIEYEFYHSLFAYLDLLNDKVDNSLDSYRLTSFTS